MAEPDPINDLIVAELGRATAECLRIRARLDALAADPRDPHRDEEREHLETLLARTDERRQQLEKLVAGLPARGGGRQ
jgi:hypothetical protein